MLTPAKLSFRCTHKLTHLDHDYQRYIKAAEGGVNLIEEVLTDNAMRRPCLRVGVLVPHYQQGRQANAGCC